MGKKVKEETKVHSEEPPLIKDGQTIIGRLSPRDYWEWRTTLTEVELEKAKHSLVEQRFLAMQKDIEMAQVKRQLFFSSVLQQQKEDLGRVEKGAEDWRIALEARIGISLKGCIIDDVTFEVKQLED